MKKRFQDSDDHPDGSEPEQEPNNNARHARAAGGGDGGSSDSDGGASGGSDDPQSSGSGSDDDDDDIDSDEERALERQLADIPLEVLAKLKQDGIGPTGEVARGQAAAAKQKTFKRETKNRPQEVTSKRPVSRFREVIQVPKQ